MVLVQTSFCQECASVQDWSGLLKLETDFAAWPGTGMRLSPKFVGWSRMWVCLKMGYTPNEIAWNSHLVGINPALQPNSKRTICDWQRLGPAAWISDRVLPTRFPESINRPHIRAGVLKISQGTDNVKSGCTHRQSSRKRTCANLLTIVPTVIAAQ